MSLYFKYVPHPEERLPARLEGWRRAQSFISGSCRYFRTRHHSGVPNIKTVPIANNARNGRCFDGSSLCSGSSSSAMLAAASRSAITSRARSKSLSDTHNRCPPRATRKSGSAARWWALAMIVGIPFADKKLCAQSASSGSSKASSCRRAILKIWGRSSAVQLCGAVFLRWPFP